jgi:hypothetical protein
MRCPDCQVVLPAEARFCPSCGKRIEAVAVDAPIDPLLESLRETIGFQYRIERLLGRGGMGAVYLAHELALDRDVAIKVLPPEHAGTSELRERFRREARTAARLSHPNIVPLYTFGEAAGLVYFVMGFVRGESLAARLARQGPLDPDEARMLLAGICDALDLAHRQGVVHRDIKPDNILIDDESGSPMLTDFGIAKATFADAQLTTAGQLIGTPHYMSPEQASGRADIGAASDLYSLGVVAYELLSGRRPFEAENPIEALTLRLTSPPVPLSSAAPSVPADLAFAIERCLEREPAKRWPDAKHLREALLPADDDPEDSVAGRMLRVIVIMTWMYVLAPFYWMLFHAFHPEFTLPRRLFRAFAFWPVPIALFALVATFRLRAEGMSLRSIVHKAFQQPRWWRSWWPPAFRRRGDQWNRLPPELKRYRAALGVLQVYILGFFLPLQPLSFGSDRLAVVQSAALAVALVLLVLMFAQRRRATRFVRARTGLSPAEASALTSTPTWRVTAWRRAPASSLLGSQIRTPPPSPATRDTAARLADSGRSTPST